MPPELIKNAVENTLQHMRLMVSGSAALPASSFERWPEPTSNPHKPVEEQHPGHVGLPLLLSIEARLVEKESGAVVDAPNASGLLRIRGQTAFQERLSRPDATEKPLMRMDASSREMSLSLTPSCGRGVDDFQFRFH